MSRREFLLYSGKLISLGLLPPFLSSYAPTTQAGIDSFFNISLAQWSMHRQLRSGQLKMLDFPVKTQKMFDIYAVEYVNQFFMDKASDKTFLNMLKHRADDHGVKSLLIMVDAEGHLGAPNAPERHVAVENHYQWVAAAEHLGCHSIRVNASGVGSKTEVKKASIDGLRQLSEFAKDFGINVLVENNKGYSANGKWLLTGPSANGKWLADVIRGVDMPNCGSLPDFGNFSDYDPYQGMRDLMPYAKGISAKSLEFDAQGNEVNTDFAAMLDIIKAANYRGYIGIEYEGAGDEDKGILATKRLLSRLGQLMS